MKLSTCIIAVFFAASSMARPGYLEIVIDMDKPDLVKQKADGHQQSLTGGDIHAQCTPLHGHCARTEDCCFGYCHPRDGFCIA